MKRKNLAGLVVLLTVAVLVPGASALALVADPDITVSPSSIDFGVIREGYEKGQTVTITNDGGSSLVIGTITITGTDAGEFRKQSDTCSGGNFAPTGWGTLVVVFSPTSPGTKSAILSIPSNDPDEPTFSVALTGISDPDIAVSPSSIDLGNVKVGSSSSGQTVTITNDGGPPLIIGTITITGTDAGEFRKQSDTCSGITFAPTGWGTLAVVFSPTSVGTKSATLSIPSNDLDEPTFSVALTGIGVASQYNLTVTSTAGGSVATPGEGTFTYNAGEVVTLEATPDAGYLFVNWTGDVGTVANTSTATTTLTMSGNYTIIANFELAVIPGDATGDGKVDAQDITKVERIIAGLDPPTPGVDANRDGNINACDITKVERIIAGLD